MRQIVFLMVAYLFTFSPAAGQDEDAIWQALKTPGAVVVLRHSYAPGSWDPPDSKIDDCTTQRNLDADGRAQAKAIGRAFRRHGVIVGDVLSSPKCRTRDTGLIAFGRVENWSALQGALSNPALARERAAQIHQRMLQNTGKNPLILITHGTVVNALLGRIIQMGELAVMLPAPGGGKFNEAGALFIRGG